jgi:hypothetical protein
MAPGAKLRMKWLEQLATELSQQQRRVISARDLRAQIRLYVLNCPDKYLRQSYPTDIHHLDRGQKPHPRTMDLVLSFMNSQYPGIPQLPIIAELAAPLSAAAAAMEREVAKVIEKEKLRRAAASGSTKAGSSFWSLNYSRVEQKYAGLYALVRRSSDGVLRVEPFAVVSREDDPITVGVFWECRDKRRVGDLLVNSYRFVGLTVNRSTDEVIEPASIAFLRAPRSEEGVPEANKPPLVMGGFIMGWKSHQLTSLFQSRIGLIKLKCDEPRPKNDKDFTAAIHRASIQEQISSLRSNPLLKNTFLPKFLERTDSDLGYLDAKNALPGLFPE